MLNYLDFICVICTLDINQITKDVEIRWCIGFLIEPYIFWFLFCVSIRFLVFMVSVLLCYSSYVSLLVCYFDEGLLVCYFDEGLLVC